MGPDPETARRQKACDSVLRRMREEATRPGNTLADAFAHCRRFYADEGYPEQWKPHRQGGVTGYGSREVIATPQMDQEIRVGQALTWNPSITEAKSEETFILTASGPGVVTRAPVE